MADEDIKENGIIDTLYSGEGSIMCCMGMFLIILIGGFLPSVLLSIINVWLIPIVWFGVISLIVLLHYLLSKTFCNNCKEFVYPIFTKHICELNIKNQKSKINKLVNNLLKSDLKQVSLIITDIEKQNLFKNEKEREIFKKNFYSLQFFESIGDYKYCMVAMGSIIEFLIERYCKLNRLSPEPYTNPSTGEILAGNSKKFANYVQSAIKNNILGQRNSWFIIQHNLRNFRNYVHIKKEVKEESIDINWFEIIKPAFDKIINSFR